MNEWTWKIKWLTAWTPVSMSFKLRYSFLKGSNQKE